MGVDNEVRPVWWTRGPAHRSKVHLVDAGEWTAHCGARLPAATVRTFYNESSEAGLCRHCFKNMEEA